jgi:multiple sugar transport system permease protein
MSEIAVPPAESRQAPSHAAGLSALSDRSIAYGFIAPTAFLIAILAVYPLFQAAHDSLFKIDLTTRAGGFVGFANYVKIATDPDILATLVRSAVWIFANLAVQVVLGLGIALLLDQPLRGRTIARGLVLFPYMVPAVVAAMVFRALFNELTGAFNYLLISTGISSQPVEWLSSPDAALWTVILVNCWKYTPFMVIVLLARLQSVPPSLRDAARVDGATSLQVLWNIVMPWLMPVLIAAMLLRTIWVANDFDLIYLLAFGGPLGATTTVPIAIRSLAFSDQNVGLASSLAMVSAAFLFAGASVYALFYRKAEKSAD